ncbi:dihydrofolate reductase [soil metagenome]
MILSSIAAMSANRTIGVNGDLPWNIVEDMRFFRRITDGHVLIMGRKTLETFPALLPRRFHIVITRQPDYAPPKKIVGDSDQFLVVQTTDEAIEAAQALIEAEPDWGKEVFNIGGGEIYSALLDETDRIYLTEIDFEVEGDAHFPRWHEEDFVEVERRKGADSGTNGLPNYDFVVYERAGKKF